MTDEGLKHRTDREVVVPWLKLLWEIYRAVVELLHKNSKYEKLYHKICEKAIKFCEDFKRVTEFRKLCDILRTHLQNLQKLTITTTRTLNRVVFEWTQEAIDLHLHTRLSQLEVATVLEQWNEGFRIVEDIYFVMNSSKKAPKPKIMAAYYEKLTRIFWVSENYLFHAYAWFKYYSLIVEFRKDLKAEEKAVLASNVLLAALIVPTFKEVDSTASNMSVEVDDIVNDKNQKMAMLLDFQANPTRQNLLTDIIAKGILKDVISSISSLHHLLECDFKPLSLPTNLQDILSSISQHNTLYIYSKPLQQVAVLKVIHQLSKVYSIIKIDKVKSILSPFSDMTFTQIEKIIIDGVSKHQLNVRIDHFNQSFRFGSTSVVQAATDTLIVNLGMNLNKVLFKLSDTMKKAQSNQTEDINRRNYLELCASSAHDIYIKSLERKGMIDELKQAIELAQQRKEESDRIKREETEKTRLEEMKRQLDIDREEREKLQQQKEELRKECEKIQYDLERYNAPVLELDDLMKLDVNSRQVLVTKAKSDFIKNKEEQVRKLVEQAKRLDYITRAQRIEASKIISSNYTRQMELDKEVYNKRIATTIEVEKKQHSEDLLEKQRLLRMITFRSSFEDKFVNLQRQVYEKELIETERIKLDEYRQAKLSKARLLHQKEVERVRREEELERQRLAKEEAERLARQQEEILQKLREEEEAIKARERDQMDDRFSRRGPPQGGPIQRNPSFGESSNNEPSDWRSNKPSRNMDVPDRRSIPPNRSNADSEVSQWKRTIPSTNSAAVEVVEDEAFKPSPGAYRPPRREGSFNDRPDAFANKRESFGGNREPFGNRSSGGFGGNNNDRQPSGNDKSRGGFGDRKFGSQDERPSTWRYVSSSFLLILLLFIFMSFVDLRNLEIIQMLLLKEIVQIVAIQFDERIVLQISE